MQEAQLLAASAWSPCCTSGGKGGSNWGGKGVWNPMFQKQGGKGGRGGIGDFPGDQRVWIGGLPTEGGVDLNKKLKEHMASTGLTCQYAVIFKKGQGGAAFKTKEEAQTAIATLNGSVFEGMMIEVDALTKGNGSGQSWSPKKGSSKGGGGSNWGGRGVFNPMDMMKVMSQMMGKGNGKGSGRGGIRDFDGSVRVWIGNLPQNPQHQKDIALNKKLKEHLSSSGLNCVYAHVGRNGGGQAAFQSESEAQQAIVTLNGTFFEGNIIQVDKLTKGGQ